MKKDALKALIEGMRSAKVLVIGDVMLDRFVYGHVSRISPESPVPVLARQRESEMLGGAGNALNNLVNLGVQAEIIGLVGNDSKAETLQNIVSDLGVSKDYLISAHDRPTTVKTRFLAGHQQLLRTDYETIKDIEAEAEQEILEAVKALISEVKAVIVSDYGKGLLTQAVISGIIEAAQSHAIPVIVDPKKVDYSIYKGASAVTPNKKELSEATGGMAVSTDEEVIAACQALLEKSGIEAVVATRSADGITIVKQNQDEPVHLRGSDIEVFDVSGAGDTVIATIAATLAAGGTLEQAGALANIAGAIVVSKVGTAPIRRDELLDALDEATNIEAQPDHIAQDNKMDRSRMAQICNWDEAAEQIQRWKAKGLKVGFTNGCFDILHYGHVSYLNEARSRCDRLVMGLNHDKSVSILKGPTRPVHDENSRATVLAALGSIDLVTFFGATEEGGDNTACDLIAKLQPDIYFKGGDYMPDEIPETPTVRQYGGEVCVMSVFEGHSTTNSIKKMQEPEGEAA